jgi:hypothetical protein
MGTQGSPFNLDPRMFQWRDNSVAIIFSGPIKTDEECHALYIQEVFPRVSDLLMLRHATEAQYNMCYEKNWSPIGPAKAGSVAYEDGFLFAYSVQPHHVMKCYLTGACYTMASTDSSAILKYYQQLHAHIPKGIEGKMHLGTNAVRLSDTHYGSLFHFIIARESPLRNKYHVVPYIFESSEPYRIVKVALKPLVLPEPDGRNCSFVFAPGLTFVQGRLVVMYTCTDATVSMYLDSVDGIFGHDMADVEDLPALTIELSQRAGTERNGQPDDSKVKLDHTQLHHQNDAWRTTAVTAPCRQNQGRMCTQKEQVLSLDEVLLVIV